MFCHHHRNIRNRHREILSIAPIYDIILSGLEPGDSVRLARTCKTAREAVNDFFSRGYNIDKLLLRFFPDPNLFRRLQARTATLISGSSALQFLDRVFYPDSDLDLYTPRRGAREVGKWILSQGYSYCSTEQSPDFSESVDDLLEDEIPDDYVRGTSYKTTGIAGVYEFRKGPLVVQLIAARRSPFHAITCFHSTVVMNFITYEGAYSLYPRATFDDRIAASNAAITDKELRCLSKYRARGWAIVTDVTILGSKSKDIFRAGEIRWVLDSHTWRIPLGELDLPVRKITQCSIALENDPSLANSWKFDKEGKINNTTGAFIVSKLLKYHYMVGDSTLLRLIVRFLAKQGEMQFRMLELEGLGCESAKDNELWAWWDGGVLNKYREYFDKLNRLPARTKPIYRGVR
ncbi:hypothetical protein FA15DRAFT_636806 [Coprinopsis marcescibilis]|uniref:Uncharacterized protein n=1 Tax=Coprinopsis marcescibilis TaxID=230819 RepID=A0A5C3L1R5_COPMA|nr:hypothetical protein FA15DRAFT_636806 [Coprinopsis marcescibilis]